MHTVNAVGDSIDYSTAAAFVSNIFETGIIDKQLARIMLAAMSDQALKAAEPA